MIAYLDTSSLVKLYLEESHSQAVRELANSAQALLVCRIAYPEARAAFARRAREGDLTVLAHSKVTQSLNDDWPTWVRLDFNELKAGDIASKHQIRGMDAIHLASALAVAKKSPASKMLFSCFDKRLQEAAGAEGLEVVRH